MRGWPPEKVSAIGSSSEKAKGGKSVARIGLWAAMLALVVAAASALPVVAARQPAQPNIILILSDDQTFETVAKMPYLKSRIPPQGGWYEFENAYINNATCCPSRATILTGQWSHNHGIEATGNAPPYDDTDTIATRLDAAGYRTGFIGKYQLGRFGGTPKEYVPPGWDEWVEHETNNSGAYYDYTLNENGLLVPYGSGPENYSTDVLARKALDFIRRNATSQPFFLIFAPRAPHGPWTPAPRHKGRYANEPVVHDLRYNEDTSDKPAWWAALPPKNPPNTDTALRKQWETLLALDNAVRDIHKKLNEQRLTGNTALLYMTDNGYANGEHRYDGKVCAYDACSRTPLYVKYLGHNEGLRFDELVSNEDLAATFADLAGTQPPSDGDGQSFAPFLHDRQAPTGWQNEVLLRGYRANPGPRQTRPYWGLRTPGYKYIETVDTGEVELYDLAADPFELQNVAGQPEYAAAQAELAHRLALLRGQ
jgi:N-acetylglucosamine-6-sulfatase